MAREMRRDPIFSDYRFCLAVISGLILWHGFIDSLSCLFLSPYIPLWDKRGKSWSRNRGLGFGIRADNGRFFRPIQEVGLGGRGSSL